MAALAVIFPFDLFGGGGSAAGAELLGDELRAVLADNRRERTPTRAAAYQGHVKLKQATFESLNDVPSWRERGRKLARQALQNEFFLWLGGNHLSVLPLYDELSAASVPITVVQLDAHLDVHNFSDLSPEPSHGNFLLHCDGPLPPLVNVGHRELLLTADHVRKSFAAAHSAERLAVAPDEDLRDLRQRSTGDVVLDIDWDVLDAAYFPAVNRPVPFGLSPAQLLQVIDAVGPHRLRGVSVSEFEPGRDANDRSLSLAVWLIEWLLLKRYEGLHPKEEDLPSNTDN